MRIGRAVVVLALVALAACTTVERAAGPDGMAAGSTTDAAGAATAAAEVTSDPSGIPARLGDEGQKDASSRRSATAAGKPGAGCEAPVKLGVSYSTDFAAGFGAVGQPDRAAEAAQYFQVMQDAYALAVADLNERGGLNGCPVQLVYHDFSVLAADGFDGQSQRECARFSEDERVFAAIPQTLESRVIIDCLAKAGVITFYQPNRYTPTDEDFEAYGEHLYQLAAISPDRWAPFIDQLVQSGYFDHGAKVGVMIADNGTGNNERLVEDVWRPRLEQLGIPVVRTFSYKQISSFSSVADASSQFQSAALQFKSAGVTHLLFTPDGGDAAIFFGAAAENAKFRPRWAITSANGPAAFESVPEAQRAGARAVSFVFGDLGASPDPAVVADNPPNETRERCRVLFEERFGDRPPFYAFCDILNFLEAGLRGAPDISPAALAAGAERLGTGFQISNGYDATSFVGGRHDAPANVRVLAWDEGRVGWVYATPAARIP